ncbi:pyridoxamine 5'-phosphate oxidase family protein [Methanobacterium formicicum]|uniref:Pyridoxamine 5'-phosphate oxidase-like FMN-binding protein n=1 Tax=Methanobacterium formicicum (strain DSM 3637 / PP1) TaxID=1204725 RepID=K2QEX2_METFP|nr:pyridoxamine 5'-phosphate oxidase family protein [Methanobacterium formicicum]EKF86646.1 pyridoxamine 5'-phosphate oxidase-like FMN-binding protein [Methanobacterium formicicum DSM 3637]
MRRSDKEIKDPQILHKILNQSEVCRIALCDGEEPYLVPMNFAYSENRLYLHSATRGRKIDILKENNNICFQMDIKTQMVRSENPCNWGMKYLSVIGSGKAHLIDDLQGKKEAMDIIMAKYSQESIESDEQLFEYSEQSLNKVLVIRVEVEEITGKKSGY